MKSHFYKVEELNINIRFEDLIKIEKFRKEVVENGIPSKNTFPNYNVEFDYKDKKFNGRIRLKSRSPPRRQSTARARSPRVNGG